MGARYDFSIVIVKLLGYRWALSDATHGDAIAI